MLALWLIVVCGLLAIGYAVWAIRSVLAADAGNARMQEIAAAVREGAQAYLKRQYLTISVAGVVIFFLVAWLLGWLVAVGFAIGAVLSGAAGFIGMNVSVRANVRTAQAAISSLAAGLELAFKAGAITGLLVAGLALLGVTIYFWVLTGPLGFAVNSRTVVDAMVALGFGASLISIFARLGGGIFTKGADVGADLVGKVEQGIPEDDPRNAATIADNVGDNVGDCAGMAADLFESYAVTLVAALILGKAAFGEAGLVFPLIVPAIGAVTAAIGVFITRARAGQSGLAAINRGFYISAVISAVLCSIAAFVYLPSSFREITGADASVARLTSNPRLVAIGAVILGIVLAGVILWLTGYFTGTDKKPTLNVARTSLTGAATVVLSGIGVGLESAVYTSLIIGAAVYGAYLLGGGSVILALFLIALAGCGLLTAVGVIVAMDTFGPVSDNAQGIAEMSGDVDGDGAQILTELDAVGNTTKAITKGIAIATAVLAATALFGSYNDAVVTALGNVGKTAADAVAAYQIVSPDTLVGVMIGSAVVFLFSGLAIAAVTRAAGPIVFEVRRQFREHPGIMDYTEKPEYGRVVDICTKDSLRELATPGLLAALTPVAVGFGLGIGPLAGYLAGAIGAGALMAVFLSNSGGSWDNAKKIVEDGAHGGKGSEAHAATVIGDTVGDPFKDTAGPAINPLIKVMNLVSVLIAPAIVQLTVGPGASTALRYGIAVAALLIAVVAIAISKRRDLAIAGDVEPEQAVVKTPDPLPEKDAATRR